MHSVEWKVKAWKQLQKIGDRKLKERILAASSNLTAFPACQNVKTLVNHQYPYRLRVGDWRLFFSIENTEITIIYIEEVKKRDDHTY
jgi:mRNA interferase RelE/StbE